jgi:nucleoside-diphosphate-sugar epimerase
MQKKVLILGSKGQIGDYLCYYLRKKKYKVFEIDIVRSKKDDLRNFDNKRIKNLFSSADFVFFLAFDVGGSVYLKKYQNTFNFINNNMLIMSNTFSKLKNKKFIFASSQMSNMNYSIYGLLKKVGEFYTSILGGISVRFWNVYGVEKDLEKSHVITDLILKGIKNKKIKLNTNGQEERDFLYVEDCCSGLEIIMNRYTALKKFKTIDLNSGKFIKIVSVAKIILDYFIKDGKKIKLILSKKRDDVQLNKKNKSDKLFFKYWKPKFSLQHGIGVLYKYYNKNYKIYVK